MADLTRFFPGLGLGGSSPKPEEADPPAAAQTAAGAGAAPPLMTPSQLTPTSGGMSGLMNPLSLLSGGTPASAAAPPPVASNGGALLAMLQGSGIPGMAEPKVEAAPTAAPPAAAEPAKTAPQQKPQQKNGITLSKGSAVHEVGNAGSSASRKQTQVTHIAAYKFQPGYRHGKLVAVSPKYICYGVRGGSIRVRHQSTAMQLLKGHTTSELADISITGEGDECMLATATESGDLFVWSISIVDGTQVVAKELYRSESGVEGISRVLWHPCDAVLLCAGGPKREGAESATEWVVKAGQGFEEGEEPSWGVRSTHSALVTSICWVSETDGVVSAGLDGTVRVSDASGNKIVSWEPYDGQPVQSALVAHPKGRDKPLIITGSAFNRCVKLWSFTGSTCYHSLELSPSTPDAWKATAELDPGAELLFLANTTDSGNQGKVFLTVHLNAEAEPHFDTLCEFDVMYTILSCIASQHSFEPHVDQSAKEIHLYTAQTEVVQQYHIPVESCRNLGSADPADPTPAPAAAPAPPAPSSVPPPSLPAAAVAMTAPDPSPPPPAPAAEAGGEPRRPSTVTAVPVAAPPPPANVSPLPSVYTPPPPPTATPDATATPAAFATAAAGTGMGAGASIDLDLSAMEERLMARMEALVRGATDALATKLEAQARERAKKEREETKKVVEAALSKLTSALEEKVGQSAAEAVQTALPREIGAAIKMHVPAALEAHGRSPAALETVKSAMDKVVTPVVDKAVKAMGDKTVAAVKPALQESFRTSFQTSLIPAFESSCQNMFEQIQATFERGIAEKVQQEEAAAAAATQMQHLQAVAETLTATLAELNTLAAAATLIAPGPAAPVVAPAPQQQTEQQAAQAAALARDIRALLQQERFEEAFSLVLSLSDLKLVVWCCHLVDSRQIFGKSQKVLSSPVVLSLVQQLGFDMRQDAQLKVTWLRDAVMSLDPKDPVVGSHVPVILRDLHEKLTAMERSPAEHPVTAENDFRLLMHVLKSIISS